MEKIGKYEIIEKLGQGGMGIVYKARDPIIQRIVAIKTLSAQLHTDPELRARFFREARSAGQLSHKNIITIYDLGEEAGRAYIAMEYLEGEDLRAKIARREAITIPEKVRIMTEVCDALAHAHERQVIHRDVKPGNIFMTPSGQVKILDFGLARVESSDITKSGQTLGTPNYMSPEQVMGHKAGHRSDIFSAGTVFYELLTCRKPFEGDSYAAIIYKILEDEPVPMQRIDSRIPHELSSIVRKTLAKDPDKRYQSAADVARDLRNFLKRLEGEPADSITDAQVSSGGRSEHPSGESSLLPEPSSVTLPSLSVDSKLIPVLPQASPSSRNLAYLSAAAVLIVAIGVTVAIVAFRGGGGARRESGATASVPAPAVEKTAANPDPLLTRNLSEASSLLENHRYSEAAKLAEAVLKASPDNAPAQKILASAQEALASIAKGNQEANALYAAGKYEEAMAAISGVLKIAPEDPGARQLSSQLDQYGRKSADEALNLMRQSKTRSEKAGAPELAREQFVAAQGMQADAERLYESSQFGKAAIRSFEASQQYRQAEGLALESTRKAAAEHDRRQATERAEAESARQGYERMRLRAIETKTDGKAPDRFNEGTRLASEASSTWDKGDFSAARRSFEAAAAAMQQAMDAAAKSAPTRQDGEEQRDGGTAAPKQQSGRQAVLTLLQRYKSAYENKDFGSLKGLWPALGGAEEKAIQEELQHARTVRLDLQGIEILFAENQAMVSCRRIYQLSTADGRKNQTEGRITLSLRNNGTAWFIEAIRAEAAR